MDRLHNFFCFPLLLLGLIFISNGFVGYVEFNAVDTKNNIQTANQINKLYSEKEITPSEKEITLKGPPITEIVDEKLSAKRHCSGILSRIFIRCASATVGINFLTSSKDFMPATCMAFAKILALLTA